MCTHTLQVSNNGNFEGPEPVAWWRDRDKVVPPPEVMAQLQSPDLVLVRPAAVDMTFTDFLRRLREANATRSSLKHATAHSREDLEQCEQAGTDADGTCSASNQCGATSSPAQATNSGDHGPSVGVPAYYIEYLSLESCVWCAYRALPHCCNLPRAVGASCPLTDTCKTYTRMQQRCLLRGFSRARSATFGSCCCACARWHRLVILGVCWQVRGWSHSWQAPLRPIRQPVDDGGWG